MRCPIHNTMQYNDKWNAYLCYQCDTWLENTCDDKDCWFCSDRPEKPSLDNIEKIEYQPIPEPVDEITYEEIDYFITYGGLFRSFNSSGQIVNAADELNKLEKENRDNKK